MKSCFRIATARMLTAALAVGLAASSALAATPAEKDQALLEAWAVPAFSSAIKTRGLAVDKKALTKLSADTSFAPLVTKALAAEADKKATSAAKRKAWCDTLRTAARMPKELGAILTPACQGARARVIVETQRFIALHVSHADVEGFAKMGRASGKTKGAVAAAFAKAFKDFKGHALVKDAVKAAAALKRGKPHTMESAQDIAERACDSADGLSCVVAGNILQNTARSKPAHTKMALKRYTQACTIGNDLGCMYQAVFALRNKNDGKGQQLLRSACSRRHGASCHLLAQLYRHGIGVAGSHEEAKKYARAGCASGDGDSCATLALTELKARKPNTAAAKAHYDQACTWGTARGCAGAAYMSEFGLATKLDLRTALKGYTSACDAGWGVACDNAGIMHNAGKGTRKNVKKAWDSWARGCALGWGLACSKMATVLTTAQKPLNGKHYPMAFMLAQDGCNDGHGSACVTLGKFYELGQGTKTNHPTALELYEGACKGRSKALNAYPHTNSGSKIFVGVERSRTKLVAKSAVNPMDGQGCVELARIYENGIGVRRDAKKAVAVITTACTAGAGEACRQLGAYHRRGVSGSVDLKAAVKAFDRGCTLKDWASCTKLGFLHLMGIGTTKDGGKALPFLQRACDNGQQDACTHMATIHFIGNGVTKDEKKGLAMYAKACKGGHAVACANLGFNHLAGVGTKQSASAALKFFKKGCDLKHHFSCVERDKLTKK